jgi:AraC family transcriptional regulator
MMNAPEIKHMLEKLLAGCLMEMSYAADKTPLLFRTFMPHRHAIAHKTDEHVFLVNILPAGLSPLDISFETLFQKCGAAEVSAKAELPEGLTHFTLPGGHYAVFINNGPAAAFMGTFNFIFTTWLPASVWEYDVTRHRFERIPPGYRPDDADAQEEIWIPVKAKQ